MKQVKNIEEITKYLIKEAQFELPSEGFLNKVLDSVKQERERTLSKAYTPIIPKSIWILIGVLLVAISIYTLTGTSENSNLLPNIDLSFMNKFNFIKLVEKIQVSNTFTYTIVFFSILAMFQLLVIKNYYTKEIANK